MKPAFLLLLIPLLASAQTAQEIMAKVAENQDRADAARAGFVYQQKVLVRMKRANGQLAREEDREYTVTPGRDGIERELVHFSGRYGVKGKEVAFSDPSEQYRDSDIDANVIQNLADSFGNDEKSRDGINQHLFPLTARKQKSYVFKLAGSERWHGREAFRITFEPRPQKELHDGEDWASWAGEVLVDKTDLTPVLITTHLARGVPVVVKTLLGTNIQQIGFKLAYEKFDDLWFPVNYSGELKLRVLFVYARTISLGMINSDFKRADVKSRVTFEDVKFEKTN